MTSINPFSALSALDGNSADKRQTIADNFDTFLTLLTTQLKNQNPLDPMDTNEFTSQLVQFTGVEQAVQTNKNLETLTNLSAANALIGAVSYIGKEITAEGATVAHSSGETRWTYTANTNAAEADFSVFDSSGAAVFTSSGSVDAGTHSFVWDGHTNAGGLAAPGNYTLQINARDSAGQPIDVSTAVSGIVGGVDFTGSEPVLLTGGLQIKIGAVRSVKTPG